MSRRYATIQNLQASGASSTDSSIESENGRASGSQREAYFETADRAGNASLGVGNPARSSKIFISGLSDYDPAEIFKETVDSLSPARGNPDFSEGINLNYASMPNFQLPDHIENGEDNPQHGVPNIRVTKESLTNPEAFRQKSRSPQRLGGFGTEYQSNDLSKRRSGDFESPNKVERIGRYFSSGNAIHSDTPGSSRRLGNSDPAATSYSPLDRSSGDTD